MQAPRYTSQSADLAWRALNQYVEESVPLNLGGDLDSEEPPMSEDDYIDPWMTSDGVVVQSVPPLVSVTSTPAVSTGVGTQKEKEWTCGICAKTASDPCVTRCGHLFCATDLREYVARHPKNPHCPVCSSPCVIDGPHSTVINIDTGVSATTNPGEARSPPSPSSSTTDGDESVKHTHQPPSQRAPPPIVTDLTSSSSASPSPTPRTSTPLVMLSRYHHFPQWYKYQHQHQRGRRQGSTLVQSQSQPAALGKGRRRGRSGSSSGATLFSPVDGEDGYQEGTEEEEAEEEVQVRSEEAIRERQRRLSRNQQRSSPINSVTPTSRSRNRKIPTSSTKAPPLHPMMLQQVVTQQFTRVLSLVGLLLVLGVLLRSR